MELLLLVGAAAYFWLKNQKEAFAQGFKVAVKDVGFDAQKTLGSLFLKFWFNVKLDVSNPSDATIKATGGTFNLIQNNTVFGTADVRGDVSIPPKQTAPVKFYVGIPVKGGMEIVKTIIARLRDGKSVTLALNGLLSLNVGNVKFNHTFTV